MCLVRSIAAQLGFQQLTDHAPRRLLGKGASKIHELPPTVLIFNGRPSLEVAVRNMILGVELDLCRAVRRTGPPAPLVEALRVGV